MVLQMTKEQFMEEMAYVLDLDENGGVLRFSQLCGVSCNGE